MAYDFPASPTEDQEFVPPSGGQTYIFKGTRWLVKGIPPVDGGGSGSGVPEAPVDGQQYAREDAAWTVVEPGVSDWSEITGKPSTFPPTLPIGWADVSGKPATYPPTLPIPSSGVTGLDAAQTAQDAAIAGKAPTVHTHAYDDITGKPATFPPTLPIAQSGVTNLTTDQAAQDAAIALKADKTYVDAADALKADKAYVDAADALLAPKASPIFTGNPTAPTPTAGDNDTSVATTAFVAAAVAAKPGVEASPSHWRYKFSTETVLAGITAGEVRLNSATFSAVTHVFIGGVDPLDQSSLSGLYVMLVPGARILLETPGGDKWLSYLIHSVAHSGAWDLTVQIYGGGSMPAGNDPLSLQVVPGAGPIVSDTAPVSATGLAQGTLWWNSNNGNLYIYYFDGSSWQWVQINSVGT